MPMTRKKRVFYCCESCGRDTSRRGGFCIDCAGPPGARTNRQETCDRPNRSTDREDPMDLEDRYDDESDPNSICNDQDGLDRGHKLHHEYYRASAQQHWGKT